MRNYFKVEQDGYDGFYLDLQREFPKLTPAILLVNEDDIFRAVGEWKEQPKRKAGK